MKSHRGESVVRDVLDAVRIEIANVGFHAMRIENVAARAEVAKTTIYRRWPKKEDLLCDLLQSMMVAAELPAETGSLRQDLLAIAHHLHRLMTSDEGQAIGRMMLAEHSHLEVRRVVERVRANNIEIPLKMIERARERGELAEGLDPEVLLSTLAGSIHHGIFVCGAPATRAQIEAIVDLLLNGCRPRA